MTKPSPGRRVWLFGALRIETGQGSLAIPGGNAQVLFAYLILSPDIPHPREQLADLLWPDAPPDRIGRYFSSLLYRLQQALGEDWLLVEDNTILLPLRPELWVDVREFEQYLRQGDPAGLAQAVALYTGDLLPEIYEDWILPRRLSLRESYLSSLLRLGQAAEEQLQLDQAFTYYHRLSHADPLNEEAHRGLMRVYARLGRQTAALQQYQLLARHLAGELQLEPLPETRALAEKIRAEAESGAIAELEIPRPFVGRQRERSFLLQQAELAQAGYGSLFLLEGEAGSGKTRLLESFAEGARWRGLTVIWGRTRELDAVTPYAPLDQALQAALSGPQVDQLRPYLSPVLAESLAGLVPRLRPGLSLPLSQQPNLALALLELLRLLTESQAYVMILDDVQWAAPAFWEILDFAGHLGKMRLLVVLAYRLDELQANAAAWEALRRLDRQVAPHHQALAGLSQADCHRLTLELGYAVPAERMAALYRLTAGNPFFLQEALAAKATQPAGAIPLSTLLQARLETLQPQARAALEIAAVLGREFSYGSWHAVGGRLVHEAAPELVMQHFLQETSQGYSFPHDLSREQVYRAIPPDRLRRLHAQAGEALRHEQADPETLAWHFEQAGQWPQAVQYHRRAGEKALKIYAYQAALNHFTQALSQLPAPKEEQPEYLPLLCLRQRLFRLVISGQLDEWRVDIAEIERVASLAGETAALLEVLEARLRLHFIDSDLAALRATAGRALSLVQEISDPAQEARFLNTLGFYLSDALGYPLEALPHLRRAIELAEATRDFALLAEALCNLCFAQILLGQELQAQESAARALALAETRTSHYPARGHALAALGYVAIQSARWEEARSTLSRAVTLYQELGDKWNLSEARFNLGVVTAAIGQHAEAIEAAQLLWDMADQVGLALDSEAGLWYRALLIRAYTGAGKLAEAEAIAGQVRANLDKLGEGRALLAVLTMLGELHLAQNQLPEALAVLTQVVAVWDRFRTLTDVIGVLLHALVARRTGDVATAQASLARVEQVSLSEKLVRFKVLFHFVRFEVSGEIEELQAARAEIERQAALFEDERLRSDFLHQVPLHREIEARWQTLSTGPPPRIVHLARLEAPLGRPLTPEEQVEIHWTIDAGEADTLVFRQEGAAALRRHRLRRLLEEAAAGGAAPTDDDLAQALGVSRRTILRDMAHLARTGFTFTTRRRKYP